MFVCKFVATFTVKFKQPLPKLRTSSWTIMEGLTKYPLQRLLPQTIDEGH